MYLNMYEQYSKITDKPDTLFTVIIFDLNKEDVIEKIKDKLKNIKNIKNTFKKKTISRRISQFLNHIEKVDLKEKLNYIYLISEEIVEIKLTKKKINVLKEYKIKNFIFKYNDRFDIQYLNNLFEDFNFVNIIYINKNAIEHILLNSTKKKSINKFNLTKTKEIEEINQYFDKINAKFIIHGNSQILKKISHKSIIFIKNVTLSENEIIEINDNYCKKNNQKKLEKYLLNLNDPNYKNKIIYGNFEDYILTEIELYKIEKLFYHTQCKNKIFNLDKSYINFSLIEIETLSKCDIGDKLLNNYGGFFGIKYY